MSPIPNIPYSELAEFSAVNPIEITGLVLALSAFFIIVYLLLVDCEKSIRG